MQRSGRIDRTLAERRAVQELINRVREEGVTLQELEVIGARLKGAGSHALSRLLRELSREEDADFLARYAYLLDYFEEDHWLFPLIGITLKRRDLPEEGRVALLAALEEYGVDVHLPPFSVLLPATPPPSAEQVSKAPGFDDEEAVRFLDDFLGFTTALQLKTVRELAASREPRVVRLLEAMLWHEEKRVVSEALSALGRIPSPCAGSALQGYLADGDPSLFPVARLSLRRLAFLGVTPEETAPLLPFHAGYVSAPDGDGYRSLLVSRWEGEGKVTVLYLQVHERRGLLAAWGGEGLDLEAFEAEVQGFGAQEELYRVAPDYVVELLRDALYWSTDLSYLPADFYLRRRMFRGEDLTPALYRPDLAEYRMQRSLTYCEGEEFSSRLLKDHFFDGWLLVHRRLYELAEEYGREEPRGEAREELLEKVCGELLTPQVELIRERLLAVADLMRRCGRERFTVAQVAALADSLVDYRLPYHMHPFLRRFAVESMELAADTLKGGAASSA